MQNSTKPGKPYPDFPLFPHATKRWAKKIRGKLHYFGRWDDPQGALAKYLDQRDDLHAGRTPRAAGDGLTVRDLVNRFLTVKQDRMATGELTKRSFYDYDRVCGILVRILDKNRLVSDLAADDFEHVRRELAKTRGPVALGNEINRIRMVFKYGHDAALIQEPMRFGPTFKAPGKRILRKAKRENGARMFEAAEVRALLEAANVQMRAMILLGVNGGLGNHDIGTLPIAAVDFENGWIDYPRPKTGIDRRFPLWPETIAALLGWMDERPESKRSLVFLTRQGNPWAHDVTQNPLSQAFRKLQEDVGLYRRGRGVYALRHVFETVAGDSRDQVAVDAVMGHADQSMAAVYRERISDDRLRRVTDHVRGWLFGEGVADGS